MSRRAKLALGLFGACTVLVVLLGMGLSRGPTLDASVFMTIARTVASGGVPYRDAWDHKPPGIYIVEAFASFILPMGDWARAWTVSLVASIGSLAVVAVVLSRHVASVAAITVTLIAGSLLLGGHLVVLGGGYSEPLALFPATIALALGTTPDRSPSRTFLAGLAAGCAVVISLQLAPALAALLIVQAVGSGRLRSAAAFLAGAAVIALAVGGWLAISGAWSDAWDALVVYNRLYVQNRELPGLDTLRRALPVLLIALPLIGGSLARIAHVAKSRAASRLELGSMLWIGIWLVYLVAQGDFLAHYAVAILTPLMILGGIGFGAIVEAASPQTSKFVYGVLIASLVIPILLVARSEPGPDQARQVPDAALAVASATRPDASLFVWGNEPLLYLESMRTPASRYVYLRPLTTPGYSDGAQAAALLADWERHPPGVIVDASIHPGGVQAYPLLQPWSFGGTPLPDALDPVRDFVRANYVEAERVDDWIIYLPAVSQ